MQNMAQKIEKIRANNWKQGSILHITDGNRDSIPEGSYIIISQDCDVLHQSFEDEPHVEAILFCLIEKYDGNLTHGKNPRKIHFQLNDNQHYECLIKNRIPIDREFLTKFSACDKLSLPQKALDNLINWLTKRYDRDAFPDEFNKRLNREKLQKLFKKHGEKIIGLFVQLNTESELSDGEIYKINLAMIIEDDLSSELQSKLQDCLEKTIDILEQSNGLKVVLYEMKTFHDITVAEFMNLKALDFDFLSYRYFPDGRVA